MQASWTLHWNLPVLSYPGSMFILSGIKFISILILAPLALASSCSFPLSSCPYKYIIASWFTQSSAAILASYTVCSLFLGPFTTSWRKQCNVCMHRWRHRLHQPSNPLSRRSCPISELSLRLAKRRLLASCSHRWTKLWRCACNPAWQLGEMS